MSQFISSAFAIAAAAAVSASAWGHGVQVQITQSASGKIETREVVYTESRPTTLSDAKRVYVMPVRYQTGGAGNGWYIRPVDAFNSFNLPAHPTGPGITYQYNSQLAGTGWDFAGELQNSNFRYTFTTGLSKWNGSAFVDPGVTQLQIFRGDGTSAPAPANTAKTDDVTLATLPLGNIGSLSNNAHHSIGYRLLGDGASPSVDAPDGIYLVGLQLSSSNNTIAASDPFYYVFYKNVPVSDADAVAAAFAANQGFSSSLIQSVPEPGMIGGAVLAAATMLRRRRSVR